MNLEIPPRRFVSDGYDGKRKRSRWEVWGGGAT